MRKTQFLFVLFFCAITKAGDLSLKNGLTLRDAEVKGVSGRNVIIVKHSSGLGMYSYSQFSPASAEVISNLYPAAAIPYPVVEPRKPSDAGQQNIGVDAEKPSPHSMSPAIETAMSLNNKLYQAARKQIASTIERDRGVIKNKLEMDEERVSLTKEVERLKKFIGSREETLSDLNLFRDETQPNRRQKSGTGSTLSWDQQQTIIYLELRDKRKELETAESRLKDIINSHQRYLEEFDASSRQRFKRVDLIFSEFDRRLKTGEQISTASIESEYLSLNR